MANSSYEVLEFRAVIKPDHTELYIYCTPDTDGGILVGGWYRAVIPSTRPALDALREALIHQSYLTGSEWMRGEAPE